LIPLKNFKPAIDVNDFKKFAINLFRQPFESISNVERASVNSEVIEQSKWGANVA
jgi:hypothetical protein